jgi:hypothetical protein
MVTRPAEVEQRVRNGEALRGMVGDVMWPAKPTPLPPRRRRTGFVNIVVID